jgi:hypothetical protein
MSFFFCKLTVDVRLEDDSGNVFGWLPRLSILKFDLTGETSIDD